MSPLKDILAREAKREAEREAEREADLLSSPPADSPKRMRISGLEWDDPRTLVYKFKTRDVGRVFVTGYDTNLPHDDVDGALRNHFSSCGRITDILIRQTDEGLLSRAIIFFLAEGAVDKALQLSGSDVGGWTAIVEPFPFLKYEGRSITVNVTGYDISRSEIDFKSAIRQHFSSCGEISHFKISKKVASAKFDVDGEDAQDKVMELDESIMCGSKIHVDVICGAITTVHTRRHLSRKMI